MSISSTKSLHKYRCSLFTLDAILEGFAFSGLRLWKSFSHLLISNDDQDRRRARHIINIDAVLSVAFSNAV